LIGKISTDDLNRDIEAILTSLLNKINAEVPALPILSLTLQFVTPSRTSLWTHKVHNEMHYLKEHAITSMPDDDEVEASRGGSFVGNAFIDIPMPYLLSALEVYAQ